MQCIYGCTVGPIVGMVGGQIIPNPLISIVEFKRYSSFPPSPYYQLLPPPTTSPPIAVTQPTRTTDLTLMLVLFTTTLH